jgi:putative NADH-flavin reductase
METLGVILFTGFVILVYHSWKMNQISKHQKQLKQLKRDADRLKWDYLSNAEELNQIQRKTKSPK